ncbi:coiled-coil domain-containing protein 196 [Phascolarctos cinereus]|uniref:Uncharacterized protein LOC110220651 n=1 Tax=Phascolarctos cinereus TaxID=38626 RepID=A0A6P5LW57_PHACI|nr:uncharacterized protein LOC110220651 [Phascolarctos cinereus]
MTSGTNPSTSYLNSRIRNSRKQNNYLKELNEDLKIRKRELVEMLKPLEEKNGTLLQNLMTNLEEKQKSLQIMRQIMTGKGGDSDDTIVLEMIKEAEELKQNLEKKNKLLQREMELLSNKQAIEDEYRMRQKAMLLKGKAEMQALKERLQRDKEQVIFQVETDDVQELHSKVIEEKIEALTKPQKANDLQLLHYLRQNLEIPQVRSKLLIPPRCSRLSCIGQRSTCECVQGKCQGIGRDHSNIFMCRRACKEQTRMENSSTKGSLDNGVAGMSGVLKEGNDAKSRSCWDAQESPQSASLKKPGCLRDTFFSQASPCRQYSTSSSHPRNLQSFFQAPHRALPRLPGCGRQLPKGSACNPQETYASITLHARGPSCSRNTLQDLQGRDCTAPNPSGKRNRMGTRERVPWHLPKKKNLCSAEDCFCLGLLLG